MVDDFGVQKSLGRGEEGRSWYSNCTVTPSSVTGSCSLRSSARELTPTALKFLLSQIMTHYRVYPRLLKQHQRFNIKIFPGVEISTIFTSSRLESQQEEPVHILAYYGSCGPARYEELDKLLSNIREGLFLCARNMVSKLNKLKVPLKWESVVRIAGKGVAPGRLHVARALFEAGHVENLTQALSRYLSGSGPAYSTGSEPSAEENVRLIRNTGGECPFSRIHGR